MTNCFHAFCKFRNKRWFMSYWKVHLTNSETVVAGLGWRWHTGGHFPGGLKPVNLFPQIIIIYFLSVVKIFNFFLFHHPLVDFFIQTPGRQSAEKKKVLKSLIHVALFYASKGSKNRHEVSPGFKFSMRSNIRELKRGEKPPFSYVPPHRKILKAPTTRRPR